MKVQDYVLGFAFKNGSVVLIEKLRPVWQFGKLNGIGGKVEDDEPRVTAMRREFREETGVDVDERRWGFFGSLTTTYPGVARVWLFTVTLMMGEEPRSMEDERVGLYHPRSLPPSAHENVRWMVPMAQCADVRADVRETDIWVHGEVREGPWMVAPAG